MLDRQLLVPDPDTPGGAPDDAAHRTALELGLVLVGPEVDGDALDLFRLVVQQPSRGVRHLDPVPEGVLQGLAQDPQHHLDVLVVRQQSGGGHLHVHLAARRQLAPYRSLRRLAAARTPTCGRRARAESSGRRDGGDGGLALERGQLVLDLGGGAQLVQLLGDVVAVVSPDVLEHAGLEQFVQAPRRGPERRRSCPGRAAGHRWNHEKSLRSRRSGR